MQAPLYFNRTLNDWSERLHEILCSIRVDSASAASGNDREFLEEGKPKQSIPSLRMHSNSVERIRSVTENNSRFHFPSAHAQLRRDYEGIRPKKSNRKLESGYSNAHLSRKHPTDVCIRDSNQPLGEACFRKTLSKIASQYMRDATNLSIRYGKKLSEMRLSPMRVGYF
jgi:hypothetical protein